MKPKLIEIIQAWIMFFNPTPEAKEIAKHRIKICSKCPHRKYFWFLLSSFSYCNLCGCPLAGKKYVGDKKSCDLRKWDK